MTARSFLSSIPGRETMSHDRRERETYDRAREDRRGGDPLRRRLRRRHAAHRHPVHQHVALLGNDLATFPDFPAEIRAPAGTLPGVSGFQVHFADYDIHTPGDALDVLVAMNPAALKNEIEDLKPNGILIVNTDKFNAAQPRQGRTSRVNPLEDGSLANYRVFQVGADAR